MLNQNLKTGMIMYMQDYNLLNYNIKSKANKNNGISKYNIRK